MYSLAISYPGTPGTGAAREWCRARSSSCESRKPIAGGTRSASHGSPGLSKTLFAHAASKKHGCDRAAPPEAWGVKSGTACQYGQRGFGSLLTYRRETMPSNQTIAVGFWVAITLPENMAPLRSYVGKIQAVDEH